MKLLKAFFVLLLICILGGGGFWFWTTTPHYTMMRLGEAVRDHDGVTFRKYCDVNRLAASAVDDLTAASLEEVGGPRLLRRLLGIALTGFLKPQSSDLLAKNIIDYVEKPAEQDSAARGSETQGSGAQDSGSQGSDAQGSGVQDSGSQGSGSQGEQEPGTGRTGKALEKAVEGFVRNVVAAIKPPSLREVLGEMGLTRKNFCGLSDFEVKGQLCEVGMKFQPPGKEMVTVRLELENTENHWRVIRIANLEVLSRILTASTSP
jgi:hypothetical protein